MLGHEGSAGSRRLPGAVARALSGSAGASRIALDRLDREAAPLTRRQVEPHEVLTAHRHVRELRTHRRSARRVKHPRSAVEPQLVELVVADRKTGHAADAVVERVEDGETKRDADGKSGRAQPSKRGILEADDRIVRGRRVCLLPR